MSEIKQNELRGSRPLANTSQHAASATPSSPSRYASQNTAGTVLAHFTRVLIVDDDAPLRRALSRFFRNASLEVTEAKGVSEALSLMDGEPDLVITDVRLPDGGGRRVVEMASLRRPAPVIVAMSGLASAREAFALAQCGARVYLTKPFAERELIDGIADLFHDSRRSYPGSSAAWSIDADLDTNLNLFANRYGVPEREMALVRLATAGVPRNRCPEMLGISENTCKTLTRRLLQRCGARSLAQIPRVVLIGEDATATSA
jgi:DNA-binding NarL/FixJ family response regulator